MAEKIILPSVITYKTDWQRSINDMSSLSVSQFALFLTGMSETERPELYKRLETMDKAEIPFVHAMSDMTPDEYRYLMKRFGTKKFNIHTLRSYPVKYPLGDMKQYIYIENSGDIPNEQDLEGFAGLLIDLSHLESDRLLNPEVYQDFLEFIKKNKVGANHISVIMKHPDPVRGDYDSHQLTDLSELDYLKNLPNYCFGEYLAIELYNSIKEQLAAIEYIKSNKLVPGI